ncbi:hypothetical protein L596_001145 [Steinernema carpocapsae]|uniref:Uncharacterized protein n=1 Tax=Steinernema carpocapsae TaxID=34508 RepID=A0A4U8UKZ0_STECR|nr:hypothetical protein L596_001145 [Steinernema carpocapsae]
MVVTRSRKRNYSESSDDDSSMRPNVVRGRSLAPPARSRAARAQTRLAAVIQGVPTSGAPQASLTTQARFAQARPQPSVPEVAAQVRSVETNESDEVIFISERQADPEIQLRMAQQARSQVTQSWNQLMVGVQTLEHPGSRSRMAEVLQQIQAQNSRTNIHQYQENVKCPPSVPCR